MHAAPLPHLRALEGGRITTVAPSTTASALTSITTGAAPSEHGLVGFRMRVDGDVLNALSWQASGRRTPDPTLVQRHAPFRGQAIPVVTKSEFTAPGSPKRTCAVRGSSAGGPLVARRAVPAARNRR